MTEDKWYEGTKEKYSPPMTERERFEEWLNDTLFFGGRHDPIEYAWAGWESCAEEKDKEIEVLKESFGMEAMKRKDKRIKELEDALVEAIEQLEGSRYFGDKGHTESCDIVIRDGYKALEGQS
jgi:hypothetical protein